MSRILAGLLIVGIVVFSIPFAAASQLIFQPDTGSFGKFVQLPDGYVWALSQCAGDCELSGKAFRSGRWKS